MTCNFVAKRCFHFFKNIPNFFFSRCSILKRRLLHLMPVLLQTNAHLHFYGTRRSWNFRRGKSFLIRDKTVEIEAQLYESSYLQALEMYFSLIRIHLFHPQTPCHQVWCIPWWYCTWYGTAALTTICWGDSLL